MDENSHHPCSTWDLRSSRVWQCFYTLSVKIFLVLWYFKKSFSALTNQSSNDWSKLHLARQLLLLFCFLFLDSMTYPCLTLSQSSLLFCVSAFLFQATKKVQTRTMEEDGRPLLKFIRLWPYRFSTVPFVPWTVSPPNWPLEQLLILQYYEAPKTGSGGRFMQCMSWVRWYHGGRTSKH